MNDEFATAEVHLGRKPSIISGTFIGYSFPLPICIKSVSKPCVLTAFGLSPERKQMPQIVES